jgi:hypothetical protein
MTSVDRPYRDAEEDDVRFYNLYGRVVIAWSQIERSIDLCLFSTKKFDSNKKAFVSWKKKIDNIKGAEQLEFYDKAPSLRDFIFSELRDLSDVRNVLVHGYLHEVLPGPPKQMKFVAARFNADDVYSRELIVSHEDLFEILKRLYRLKFEMLAFGMAFRGMYKKDN